MSPSYANLSYRNTHHLRATTAQILEDMAKVDDILDGDENEEREERAERDTAGTEDEEDEQGIARAEGEETGTSGWYKQAPAGGTRRQKQRRQRQGNTTVHSERRHTPLTLHQELIQQELSALLGDFGEM